MPSFAHRWDVFPNYMDDKAHSSVVAGPGQAGTRLPITPDMVVAARDVLWQSGRLSYDAPGADELLVEAMLRAALDQPLNPEREARYVCGEPREGADRSA
jgi:hypothetical protein